MTLSPRTHLNLKLLLQHTIADEYRGEYNLSTNVYRKTDYDRLCLSLTSPLPNEQVRINTANP